MAWSCSGNTNEELVLNMCRKGLINDDVVKDAFLAVDRGHFTPLGQMPYEDAPQSINYGATISAPHMHASAIEYLLPYLQAGTADAKTVKKTKILDVGSGSGYLCQVMAEIAGENSEVVGIEHIQPLVDMGINNVAKSSRGRELLESGRIKFVFGDGRKGWLEKEDSDEEEVWDVIHVGAAAAGMPNALKKQLKTPGRMFIPVEDEKTFEQEIWVVDKHEDGKVEEKRLYGVRYVPLTDAKRQWRSSG